MNLIIKVPCRICNRLFIVASCMWLTRPRPCCDNCMELDEVTKRVDSDGWEV